MGDDVAGSEDVRRRLLATPFVASWLGSARVGTDRFSADWSEREAAWAQWAAGQLAEMHGARGRTYAALLLEGTFHDPRGRGPLVAPHLEVPQWALDSPDRHFPRRLAACGNGLAFPWWLVAEVTAVRRALFNHGTGDPTPLLDALAGQRPTLAHAVSEVLAVAGGSWSTIEEQILATDDGLAAEATGDFTVDEVAALWPGAAAWGVEVAYDARLRESAGTWASRRVGVWQLRGTSPDGRQVNIGVCTPRLTANSQLRDPLFAVDTESPAALLVRALLLRRLARTQLGVADADLPAPRPTPVLPAREHGAHLRAVPARVGAKLPEASVASAVYFLHHHPDPDTAWLALSEWANRTGTLLTVSEDGYKAAYRRAARFLRRAEEPERDDVNVILPLGWDDQQRVVRVSYSRPPAN
jgi:hypothetical protein